MSEVVRSNVPVGDAELSVLAAGPEEGEPIVLVHGIPSGAELWREILERLAVAGYRAYAPDMPGYGTTRLPRSADHSLAGAAELLGRWLRQERIGSVWMVGHDLGGGVAQIMAVRNPELIRRLTLTNTLIEASWPVPIIRLFRAVARLRLYPVLAFLGVPYIDPYFRRELRRAFAFPERLYEGDMRRRVFFDTKVSSPRGRRAFAAHLAALDTKQSVAVAPGLGSIDVPTLLIWGLKDPHQPWQRVGERLRKRLPDPEVILIENASHFAMLDQPEEFTRALLKWRRGSKSAP